MMNYWRIIVGKDIEGNPEYQVSDGDVGERTESCDFKTFNDAKEHMDKLNGEKKKDMSKGKIYIKNPWATRILQGIKFIETRTFRLPDRFMDIYLDIQNENGFIVGSVKFCKSFKYESEEHFNRDQFAHLVEKDSPFHYSNRSKVHGWLIQDVKPRIPKMAYKFKSQFPLELYPSPIS